MGRPCCCSYWAWCLQGQSGNFDEAWFSRRSSGRAAPPPPPPLGDGTTDLFAHSLPAAALLAAGDAFQQALGCPQWLCS
jgi:hypothetical protein